MNEAAITTKQAAEILGVHPVTLRKWRTKSEELEINTFEDCHGLYWYYETPRKILYYTDTVQRLKRILNRRKSK